MSSGDYQQKTIDSTKKEAVLNADQEKEKSCPARSFDYPSKPAVFVLSAFGGVG